MHTADCFSCRSVCYCHFLFCSYYGLAGLKWFFFLYILQAFISFPYALNGKKKQFFCVDTTEKMIQKREIMTFKNNPLIAQANVEWKQAFYSLRRCSCFLAFLTCLLFVNNKSLYIALI